MENLEIDPDFYKKIESQLMKVERNMELIKNEKPNFYKLWKSYFKKKNAFYIEFLKNMNNSLNIIKNNENDISNDSIVFLSLMYMNNQETSFL